LLRFAHKIPKKRLQVDFLPCKLPKEPINHGFAVQMAQNPQAQQAARECRLPPEGLRARPPPLYSLLFNSDYNI
jgi:hypothetical protein